MKIKWSEYTPVEKNEDKKHGNDPMETTQGLIYWFLRNNWNKHGFYNGLFYLLFFDKFGQ